MAREACGPGPRLDRYFWLAILIAAAVVVPRSLLITAAHSPTMDEQWHVRDGIAQLTGNPSGMVHSAGDPSLGEQVCAFPLWVTGCWPEKPMDPATLSPRPLASEDRAGPPDGGARRRLEQARAARRDVLFGHRFGPDDIRLMISAWKSLLFLPAAGLVFHWARRLYGLHAGWLALALVLVDPTFAAHIPMATTDVPAVEGVLFACYFTWRAMEEPGRRRLLAAASAFTAAALLLKLTTTILPVVVVATAALFVVGRDGLGVAAVRRRANMVLAGGMMTCLSLWAMGGFEYAAPGAWLPAPAKSAGFSFYRDVVYPAMYWRWPAANYIEIFINGIGFNQSLRWAYLLGQANHGGWWYYFPVVAAYKVPLGYVVVFAAAVVSLFRVRPRFDEWSLALPLAGWLVMLLVLSHINTGFRHFLPAYVFLLMLASRAVVRTPTWVKAALWTAVAASFAHTLTYHPDYLSYFNRPVDKPWLVCNDSNVDWGQGLKEVRQWLDQHPTDRPVYLRYDWDSVWVDYYLPGGVRRLKQFDPVPTSGLLIICPVWEAGYWDFMDQYAFLRPLRPVTVIGHAMPVYDLDDIQRQKFAGAP